MSFAIFNESFYLNNNPDVQAAINAGTFPSGLSHFQQFGLAEGRVQVSSFYSEAAYLQNNPDVASAVNNRVLTSGLQHFIQFGEAEGRVSISPLWNETTYLSLNPDVASAVNSGTFASGLQHFLAFGNRENRAGTPSSTPVSPAGFNEQAYLAVYPDIRGAVEAGVLSSGLGHYQRFGQFEPTRSGFFFGTSGNDVINAFGESTSVIGIGFSNIRPLGLGAVDGTPTSFGVGETDILIGGSGRDLFTLGLGITPSNPGLQKLYVGNRSADFGLIRNFDINEDLIQLAGDRGEYLFGIANGSLQISNTSGDLIGVVEGITDLRITDIFEDGTFILSGGNGLPIAGSEASSFDEPIYLTVNSDVAAAVSNQTFASGFAHYQQFGQFEGRVGVFTGSNDNDIVTGFGQSATIAGVGLEAVTVSSVTDVRPTSVGVNQIDTLIGNAGSDTFILGTGLSAANATVQPFYLGNDNADFALIENFDRTSDRLQLAGNPSEYTLSVADGSLTIVRNPGDLVAIVEGVTSLEVETVLNNGTFFLG